MAQAHVFLGELDQARQCWLEAAERGIEVGWKNGLPGCLHGLAMVAGLEGHKEAALRFHFVAERLNADLAINFAEPVDAAEAELITRLIQEVDPQVVERIRSESETLEPRLLLRSVETAG